MRATQAVSLTLIVWMFCSPLAVFGQTGSTKQSTTKKAATSADQTATLTKEVQQYQTLLQNPDVISVPALSSAIKEKWITATCQLEVLSLPPSVIQNPTFVDQLSSACSARLHAAPSRLRPLQPRRPSLERSPLRKRPRPLHSGGVSCWRSGSGRLPDISGDQFRYINSRQQRRQKDGPSDVGPGGDGTSKRNRLRGRDIHEIKRLRCFC